MPDHHRVVLVPERHVATVEAYLRDLEDLDAEIDTGRQSVSSGGRSPSRSK